MQLLFIAGWWSSLDALKQAFWSIAIICTLLLGIFFVLRQFEIYQDRKDAPDPKRWLNAQQVFLFFSILGWSSAIFMTPANWPWMLAITGLAGISVVWFYHQYFSRKSKTRKKAGDYRTSIGEVLQPIPSHRNGFGKVHLNLRTAPRELEAITAGQEIPRGTPVRVVDVIDNRVLLVEPIPQHDKYPGQRK